jgi:nucleotide-binding universal stress UspA family protein
MYQRILVAVDGSPSSDLALGQAITVARATGADVRVLFIADDSDLFFDVDHMDPSQIMDGIVRYGENALARAAAQLRDAGVLNATTQLIERPVSPGQISDTIVAQATQWRADLIVLGTHGRRGLRRMVMGSVSEGVISKTGLPVLLIRAPREA